MGDNGSISLGELLRRKLTENAPRKEFTHTSDAQRMAMKAPYGAVPADPAAIPYTIKRVRRNPVVTITVPTPGTLRDDYARFLSEKDPKAFEKEFYGSFSPPNHPNCKTSLSPASAWPLNPCKEILLDPLSPAQERAINAQMSKEFPMTSKNKGFGAFLSGLATKAEGVTAASLASLKSDLEAQRQEQLKRQLRQIFDSIESNVEALRSVRRETKRREAIYLTAIKDLEQKANDIVSGKTED
jgi:hypothetical protein